MNVRDSLLKAFAEAGRNYISGSALAEQLGVNMHTVNKAYSILREEGYLTVDRRRGAVAFIDHEKINAREKLREELRIALAKANCKDITKEDVHALIDEIYEEYQT